MSLNISYGGYVHTQTIASDTWTIVHSLNCKPVVDVYITHEGALTKVLPFDITFPDSMTCIVLFTVAQSGTARCL